jgi:outer membrane receptor protein involved in Fe transport
LRYLGGTGLAIVLLSTAAHGQEPTASVPNQAPDPAPDQAKAPAEGRSPTEYADIIVTANKRNQNINDVGLSITALGGEELIGRGVSSPTDLGKIVPGLTVQPSPFNTPVYTLRGIGFYETTLSAAPTVAVYTDEVALPFSATTRGVAFDIERVEVLKGPQGTLFGNNTTGGAINYIAAKPTDAFSAGADASFGRFSTFDVQGFVSGPLSDTLKARLAVRTVQSGPWQKSFTRDAELGKMNQFQGRLQLQWDPSDKMRFLLNVNGWTDNGDTQAAQLIEDTCGASRAGTCGSPDADNFRAYPRSPRNARAADWGNGIFGRRPARDDRFFQASLRADIDLNDDLTLTSVTAYSDYKTDSVQDFDGTTYFSVDTNTTGYIHDFAQELRINGRYNRLNFILGGNYNKATTYDRLFYNFSEGPSSNPLYMIPGAPRGLLTFNYSNQDVTTWALFGNVEFQLSDRLTLLGGARYTKSNRDFEGCTNDFGGGTAIWWNAIFGTNVQPGGCLTFTSTFPVIFDPAVFDKLDEDNVAWNVGVNYKTAGDTLLYTRVSRGYKSGSFPTASVASYTGYTPVKQESVTAYEAGFKAPLFDRALELTAAAFYYDYKDKQLRGRKPDPVFGTLDGLVQIPKSRVQGVEMSLLARPVLGLTLSGGATYISTKIKDYTGFDAFGQTANFKGQKFPFAPKLTFIADAEYKFPFSSSAEGYFGVSLTYNSKTSSALANTDTAFLSQDDRFDMRSYALVDLRAGFEVPASKVRAGIYVRNVGNVYYWTNVQDNLASISRFAGMPRTYGVQVSWRY